MKSKKVLAVLLTFGLITLAAAGCGNSASSSDDTTIVVGASPAPHAEILEAAKDVLADKGYTLEVQEFTDYVMPNSALAEGSLDANFFQHKPYLDNYNQENGTDLVSAGAIHYEPMGIYAGKTTSLDALPDGATVAIPNDTTNENRALLLLQENGLITLKEDAGLEATPKDIADNPKNLKFSELEAAAISRSLQDVDIAVINGNYAIEAGLNLDDALAQEKDDSDGAQLYQNIIAVRNGDENSDKIKALVEALKSDTVKQYIEDTYKGAVVPVA